MKIKSYSCEVTDFYRKEILKVGSNHISLAVFKIDSALKDDKNYYLQVFLMECKYIEKEKKVIRRIIDEFKNSSHDSDEE